VSIWVPGSAAEVDQVTARDPPRGRDGELRDAAHVLEIGEKMQRRAHRHRRYPTALADHRVQHEAGIDVHDAERQRGHIEVALDLQVVAHAVGAAHRRDRRGDGRAEHGDERPADGDVHVAAALAERPHEVRLRATHQQRRTAQRNQGQPFSAIRLAHVRKAVPRL